MSDRYTTTPFDDEPDDGFTFSDATLLTFIGVVGLALAVIFVLGTVCAEHRIADVLMVL